MFKHIINLRVLTTLKETSTQIYEISICEERETRQPLVLAWMGMLHLGCNRKLVYELEMGLFSWVDSQGIYLLWNL